ncbi:hypothetical protein RAS1_13450 [Phycisphaerae bacterium RAS1]|nr:hypothetical protein RAS1_13450 [Phycisphaerae bacterium RAS1]
MPACGHSVSRHVRSRLLAQLVLTLMVVCTCTETLAQDGRPNKRARKPATQPAPRAAKDQSPERAGPTGGETKKSSVSLVPTRPVRQPVDVSDLNACWLELAALASFECTTDEYREPAVGFYPYPNRITALDRAVRFDHLMKCADPELRGATARLRAIVFDNWAVNRLEEIYGDTPESRKEQLAEMMVSGFEAATQMWLDAERPRSDTYQYYDSQGALRELQVTRDDDYSQSENALAEQGRLSTALKQDRLERSGVSSAANIARELLAVELLAFWSNVLLHKLPQGTNGTLDFQLHRALIETSDTGLATAVGVEIVHRERALLHNVLVRVDAKDEFGQELTVFAFQPELAPNSGFFVGLFGEHWRWFGHAPKASFQIAVQAQQGKWTSEIVHPEFVGMGAGRITAATAKKHADQRARLQAASATERARGGGLLRVARERFPLPVNPEFARKKLSGAAVAGRTYTTVFRQNGETYNVALTIDSFDEQSELFRGHVKLTGDVKKDSRVYGRFCEEVERGTVVGFLLSEESEHGESDDKLDRMIEVMKRRQIPITPEKEAELRGRKQQGNENRKSKEETNWAEGKIWLLTSPIEIALHEQHPVTSEGALTMALGITDRHKPGLTLKARAKRARAAQLVLFQDASGNLMLQSAPHNKAVVTAAVQVSKQRK